ncbi:ribosome biogenesis GTPase Der [Helicobacter sp. MIT 01-3238]|uniref:ribosome biogenesis GTPase Der n=1 Tax=Helicobacter sp. MIT 01-3238 TaxID=398627 RepID=UPI000E1F5C6D|nr:ribosome biogenesis GTPase Der [Helicobacter sp. MIT 01-3238]RDU55719.1 ribosome biogenesis GTPase Der [Helicobacter sp. MIT 01-3238]
MQSLPKAPKIAIIGRPNVGKSCLFNRLAKQKIAITSDISGTTRDTNYTHIYLLPSKQNSDDTTDTTQNPKSALLIDTGGIEQKSKDELFLQVGAKAKQASKQADLVLYVVDGQNPPNDEDREILYEILRLKDKKTPCFLVVNKIDSDAQNEGAYAFYEFGVQEVFFISVAHNRGITTLQNAMFSALFTNTNEAIINDDEDILAGLQKDLENQLERDLQNQLEKESSKESESSQKDSQIKIGIIGRVNVGKSSLLNALTQKERAIVSKKAGTTIDPVDESIEHKGKLLTFIDTAGIRKRGKIQQLEKFALDRTNKILAQSDIALLVLDASERLCELDERIFSLTQKHALGVIVLWNKWDIKYADFKTLNAEFERKFRFLEYAPKLTISAKNKRHINELKDKIIEIYQNFSLRIPTAKLNETIAKAIQNHAIPSDKGKLVKIYYATQYESAPPQIALISNRPNSIHFSYKRYLINCLREEFSLSGVPLILSFRDKNAKPPKDDKEE